MPAYIIYDLVERKHIQRNKFQHYVIRLLETMEIIRLVSITFLTWRVYIFVEIKYLHTIFAEFLEQDTTKFLNSGINKIC
jgi:hypothetical protein